MNIDEEWELFVQDQYKGIETVFDPVELSSQINKSDDDDDDDIPECEDLSISTNTKVLFLNQEVDIQNVFWNLHISNYQTLENCVIKKQIKIVNNTPEEYETYQERINNIKDYYTEVILKRINNPEARRNKFKDERKLTVGFAKKDILTSKAKVKNAFYNCFAMTIRFLKEEYHEIHVKVFNTGKLEIPGIVNGGLLDIIKENIVRILTPLLPTPLAFVATNEDNNVLINSNFNCGFHIKREVLHHILKSKYHIETSYDPCSYPGIKSKYYYNMNLPEEQQNGTIDGLDRDMKRSELEGNKKYREVSFMVFRTGSCLIVGNCSEQILFTVYRFIRKVLQDEYQTIRIPNEGKFIKEKKTKTKKIKHTFDLNYHSSLLHSMQN
jgi:hypothetical protein